MSTQFPTLDNEQIIPMRRIMQAIGDHGIEILDRKDCPYDKDTVAFLKTLVVDEATIQARIDAAVDAAAATAKQPVSMLGLTGTEHLIAELSQVYTSLDNVSLQGKDKLQGEKAKLSAIEKIVGLKERLLTLKQLTEFQSVIMVIMEQVLSPEQREEFLTKLEAARRKG